MDNLKPFIALFLKAHRLHRNWTPEIAAVHAHMSLAMLEQFETGNMITLETIANVAFPYKLRISKIFEFAEIAQQFGPDAAFKSEAPYLEQ